MDIDVPQFFAELDGGVFEQKIAGAIADTALAVSIHERQGEVTIKLKIKPTASESRVNVEHEVTFQRPTKRGVAAENDKTSTPMHVGKRGKLTFFPEAQQDLQFEDGEQSRTPN